MTLFVTNFPRQTTVRELRDLFSAIGKVQDVCLVMNRETGESKCFGFIQMEDHEAAAALELNGTFYGGRRLVVKQAKNQQKRYAAPLPAGRSSGSRHAVAR